MKTRTATSNAIEPKRSCQLATSLIEAEKREQVRGKTRYSTKGQGTKKKQQRGSRKKTTTATNPARGSIGMRKMGKFNSRRSSFVAGR